MSFSSYDSVLSRSLLAELDSKKQNPSSFSQPISRGSRSARKVMEARSVSPSSSPEKCTKACSVQTFLYVYICKVGFHDKGSSDVHSGDSDYNGTNGGIEAMIFKTVMMAIVRKVRRTTITRTIPNANGNMSFVNRSFSVFISTEKR